MSWKNHDELDFLPALLALDILIESIHFYANSLVKHQMRVLFF